VSILTLPGLIDAHVHLREPGATHKEDIASGTRAALAGGVVGLLDMPNNQPPIVTAQQYDDKSALFAAKALCAYGLLMGYQGGSLEHLLAVASQAAGLKLYLDSTFGEMVLRDPQQLDRVFAAWPGPGPIAVHAESAMIRQALQLAQRHGSRLHVCHVPDPDDLIAIDRARQAGARVTCEVTPHHLFLDTSAQGRMGALAAMKPPLLPPDRVALFWRRLSLVDVIATDHAPHTLAEKRSPTPPPGVPGLETLLPLLLWAAEQGRLSLDRLIELTWHGPLRAYQLEPPSGCQITVELGPVFDFPAQGYQSRCGWSPFVGQKGLGRVVSVTTGGNEVWREGQLLARPGAGQRLQHFGANSQIAIPVGNEHTI
jgi:carbamoyl-phosphate synthase/aspartate carbamoyltransferase/dihydroorotase